MVGIPLFESKHAPVLWLTVLVGVAPRVAQPGDIKGWGAAAATEAQWCHPFEVSEIPGIAIPLTSRNIVPRRVGLLARALIPIW
jgi:hypothetical protein